MNGFFEVNTYPMISKEDMNQLNFPITDLNTLANPISAELAVMRASLLPSLLKIISYHQARQMPQGTYFEIGRGFHADSETTYLTFAISSAYFIQAYNMHQQEISNQIFQHAQHCLMRWFFALKNNTYL